jgi:hypothetical protein
MDIISFLVSLGLLILGVIAPVVFLIYFIKDIYSGKLKE